MKPMDPSQDSVFNAQNKINKITKEIKYIEETKYCIFENWDKIAHKFLYQPIKLNDHAQ